MTTLDMAFDPSVLGFVILAVIVPFYVWWEWRVSTEDRERRLERRKQIQKIQGQ